MKKMRVTVEGKTYDVTVEILEDDERIGSPALEPPPVHHAPPAPSAGRPAPRPAPGGGVVKKGDHDTLAAPLAGTVLKVFVHEGAVLEDKAPVVLMDAMKMETYIYAPRAGVVDKVYVSPTQTVQAGDSLIRLVPEG
jgi:biotin carboxyl carrier protein